MTTKNFVAEDGAENSVTISTKAHGCMSPNQIGFVSESGVFFFDTEGSQFALDPVYFKELAELIKSVQYRKEQLRN